MSELFSSVFGNFVKDIKDISIKPGTIFLYLPHLLLLVVFFPEIRNEFNSVFSFFGWGFDWYKFLEDFSQMLLVQIFFMIMFIMSVYHVLEYPQVIGYATGWLIFSVTFLKLGNFWSFWEFIGASLIVIVSSGFIQKSIEIDDISDYDFSVWSCVKSIGLFIKICLVKVVIALLVPIFFLWNITSEQKK